MALAGQELRMREIRVRVGAPLFAVTLHTLVFPAKSTRRCAVLWLIRPPTDHLWSRGKRGLEAPDAPSRLLDFISSNPTTSASHTSLCEAISGCGRSADISVR